MYFVAVELHSRRNLAYLTINAGIDVSTLGQRLEQFTIMTLATLYDGCHKCHLAAIESLYDKFAYMLVCIVYHLLVGDGGVGACCTRIEQTQEVIDFRYGTDRRTRIFVSCLLLDSHNGTQSRNLIYVGALHRAYKLTCVGRQSLHIATLSFGVNRVEGQRRLSRS